MPQTLQTYIGQATEQARAELVAAYEQLPEDKRDWSPGGDARTALDMIVECVILNDMSELLATKTFPERFKDMDAYGEQKNALKAEDWPALKALLQKSTDAIAVEMKKLPDSDLEAMIDMPWGPMSVSDTLIYPYWNMKYHVGQINYILAILGLLK